MPQLRSSRVIQKPGVLVLKKVNTISGGKQTIKKINPLTSRPISKAHQNARDRTASLIVDLKREGKTNAQIKAQLQRYSVTSMLNQFQDLERVSATKRKK